MHVSTCAVDVEAPVTPPPSFSNFDRKKPRISRYRGSGAEGLNVTIVLENGKESQIKAGFKIGAVSVP